MAEQSGTNESSNKDIDKGADKLSHESADMLARAQATGEDCSAVKTCPLHKDFMALINDLQAEKALNEQVRKYAQAMGVVYPLVINLDYKNDTYSMLEYDRFVNKSAAPSGKIDDLILRGKESVPDTDLSQAFWDTFNRQATIDAFAAGKKELTLFHPQNGDDGHVHYMETKVICLEYSDEKIEGISICRCVDEEAERDKALMGAAEHARVVSSLSTIYTTIMIAHLETRGYTVVKSVDLMKTTVGGNRSGDFDKVKPLVIENFMHPDSHENMWAFLDFDTLPDRLAPTGTVLTVYKDPNGKWFEARFIAHEYDDKGKLTQALYAAREITAEKERELLYNEKLRAAVLEAEKANVSKTNFLRRMSHDIRTPLNGIVGMLHISEKFRDNPEKFDECIDKVLRSTNYLLDLVNNVLDISKLESGSIVLENKPFDLAQVLYNTLPIIESYATENSVLCKGGKSDIRLTHRFVIGSPVHLNRILMNIASNAIKYNRTGGYIKLICNELSNTTETATYEFICEDTGLGMSEEFQAHAFEPFSQEGKETTTSFNGSGLGLSIVREMVERMGGTIELKSQENVGTTIKVILTFVLNKEEVHTPDTTEDLAQIDLTGQRALLVEDNGINLEIAEIMLEDKGLIITTAENGLEALNIFKESKPYTFDYIFMDMMMPVMDGVEASREIRALDRPDAKTVPIIAMTANAFTEDRELCLEAGMNEHVGKPIDAITLNRAIRNVMRTASATQPAAAAPGTQPAAPAVQPAAAAPAVQPAAAPSTQPAAPAVQPAAVAPGTQLAAGDTPVPQENDR